MRWKIRVFSSLAYFRIDCRVWYDARREWWHLHRRITSSLHGCFSTAACEWFLIINPRNWEPLKGRLSFVRNPFEELNWLLNRFAVYGSAIRRESFRLRLSPLLFRCSLYGTFFIVANFLLATVDGIMMMVCYFWWKKDLVGSVRHGGGIEGSRIETFRFDLMFMDVNSYLRFLGQIRIRDLFANCPKRNNFYTPWFFIFITSAFANPFSAFQFNAGIVKPPAYFSLFASVHSQIIYLRSLSWKFMSH